MIMTQRKKSEDKTATAIKGSSIPGSQGLWKALNVMKIVSEAPGPLRFSDLQRLSGLPKPSLHRTLQVLCEFDMLRLNAPDQTYRLGAQLFEMAHAVWGNFDLRSSAEPELVRLRQLAHETVHLAVFDIDSALVIDQLDYSHPLQLTQRIGSRMPLHASALGKALLAHQSPAEIADHLKRQDFERLTSSTLAEQGALRRHLDLVKARGYAVSLQEQFEGVNAVAAPILNHQGRAIGAIGISGAAFRLTEDRLHGLAREVIESARRTSGNAGEAFMSITVTKRPAIPRAPSLKTFVPGDAFLGEAPLWQADEGRLTWLDILRPSLHSADASGNDQRTTELAEMTTSIAPRRSGGYICTTQSAFALVDPNSGRLEPFAETPISMEGVRFNDGKCDSQGRYWAGTLSLDASPGGGTLFCLDTEQKVEVRDENLHICNGIDWSPDDRTMYLADSGKRVIYRYAFEAETGELGTRELFYEHDTGGTLDGLVVDEEGFLWTAVWDGWRVLRLRPDGKVERTVDLPVPRPTSCTFGGESMKTLFITSARVRLAATQLAEAPESGSVFALETDVSGRPVHAYGG